VLIIDAAALLGPEPLWERLIPPASTPWSILREFKVVVCGYTQQFAVNPKVQVFWNCAPVGSVKKGDYVSFKMSTVSALRRIFCRMKMSAAGSTLGGLYVAE
jgi:hypothetical protein